MKRLWTLAELAASWSLTFDKLSLLKTKPARTCLGFCVQLKFYLHRGRFPHTIADVPDAVVAYLADQLGVETAEFDGYAWSGSSVHRHRRAILKFLGVRRARKADKQRFIAWLKTTLCPDNVSTASAIERAGGWFQKQRLLCPPDRAIERLFGIARRQFERDIIEAAAPSLAPLTMSSMEGSLPAP